MSGPSVYLTLPSWDLLKFPPDPLPAALPPPVRERTLRSPFGIQPWLFNAAMHPAVPFGFAITYVIIVLNINAYNRSRDNKPWWISQQKLFKAFVIVHNLVLAVYSAATFLAMLRAAAHTIPDLASSAGPAGFADALCKLHGPRVLGDAVTYNTTINIWESKNQFIRITGMGNPDPTDVGRLWNEGLAFWGWIFYLSKFYEVVDTLIIVAKGKRSPTLQTYHHAGAMLCMWAGMRYMSPPIWMFVFINSAIHAMMYVYFALAAMNVKVPQSVKRTLTTMQITQFLFGATYAGLHLFIAYDIPVSTPYQVAAKVAAVASSASSAFSSATSVVSAAVETPTAAQSLGLLIKKLLLRAAGEEGAAERIGLPTDRPVAEVIESKLEDVKERIFHQPVFEIRWRTEYTKINCIDTSGEAFAIWLNLLYLAPLTVLFARFFIKSYIIRGEKPKNVKQAAQQIKKDAKTAEVDTERTVEEAGKRAEDVVKDRGSDIKKEIRSLHEQLKEDIRRMQSGDRGKMVGERIESFEKQVRDAAEKAKEQAMNTPRKNTASKDEPKSPESDVTDQSPEKKKKKKNKHKNKDKAESAGARPDEPEKPSTDESEKKQDAVLAATEPTRPAPEEDDTDAMGKSGVELDPTKPDAPSYADVAADE